MFRAGDPMGMFYKVTKGIVAVHRSLEDGRRQIVGVHTIGDLCGYLQQNGTYNFGGDAVTDVEACGFDRRRFDAFVGRHPDLAYALATDMTDKLKRTAETMAAIGQLKASERVAYFLLQLADTYTRRLGAKPPLTLHLTRQQIAHHLGLSLETVSRAFSSLRNRKLIALEGPDTVAIPDHALLAKHAALKVV